ncbi:hypothetical protein CEUSTIGMA_g8568.t1 [Chlamydomonas eustigma]|uniref:Uncharacterized protein n=1 Tax=Chlamydomonas eustigma TaxID=1157962 RepID=A0A250XDH5_9CHLO|nr:hypothetical protein CEUSTIGMA_g8568.t1 [Chlamydomonas eustigma]|eukprot:GAX81134.1 hypothetical protein CEUSTIGMA_g8568.t1 [Chlamydomonas eustigma]
MGQVCFTAQPTHDDALSGNTLARSAPSMSSRSAPSMTKNGHGSNEGTPTVRGRRSSVVHMIVEQPSTNLDILFAATAAKSGEEHASDQLLALKPSHSRSSVDKSPRLSTSIEATRSASSYTILQGRGRANSPREKQGSNSSMEPMRSTLSYSTLARKSLLASPLGPNGAGSPTYKFEGRGSKVHTSATSFHGEALSPLRPMHLEPLSTMGHGEVANSNVIKPTTGELDLVDGCKPTPNSRSSLSPLQKGSITELKDKISLNERRSIEAKGEAEALDAMHKKQVAAATAISYPLPGGTYYM